MTPSITLSIPQRIELEKHEITLNGQPARIGGILNDFATIGYMNGGMSAEFAWPTVKHIIENKNGAFKA